LPVLGTVAPDFAGLRNGGRKFTTHVRRLRVRLLRAKAFLGQLLTWPKSSCCAGLKIDEVKNGQMADLRTRRRRTMRQIAAKGAALLNPRPSRMDSQG